MWNCEDKRLNSMYQKKLHCKSEVCIRNKSVALWSSQYLPESYRLAGIICRFTASSLSEISIISCKLIQFKSLDLITGSVFSNMHEGYKLFMLSGVHILSVKKNNCKKG